MQRSVDTTGEFRFIAARIRFTSSWRSMTMGGGWFFHAVLRFYWDFWSECVWSNEMLLKNILSVRTNILFLLLFLSPYGNEFLSFMAYFTRLTRPKHLQCCSSTYLKII
jgi:hypothetical protein